MNHPKLGPLTRDERDWLGTVRLPSFAACGGPLRQPGDPPAGLVRVRVEDQVGVGPSPRQDAAITRLLDDEPAVFAAVWAELAEPLKGLDLRTEAICTGVEVSAAHADGVAYLGFSVDADMHLEHGLQVVYHPTRGTFWGDWEALNSGLEADDIDGIDGREA
jgi:hypothetical protein